MSEIYHQSLLYRFVRHYAMFGLRRFYSEVIVTGRENLPTDDSALIFTANHLNALMDALSLALLVPKEKAIVFLAKADLFDTNFGAKVMRFAKILPAYRMENGIENLGKNNDIFEQCIDILVHGQHIGIMPEGGQGEQRRVRPLVKGVFRIAFETQRRLGKTKSVKIIPVGIDMGDLIKSNKHLIINIGKPIDIENYVEEYVENPSGTTNQVKAELRHSLSALTRDVASVQNYDTIAFLSDVEGYKFIPAKEDPRPTLSRFHHQQAVIKNLIKLERENPTEFEKIKQNAESLHAQLDGGNFRPAVFSTKKTSIWEFTLGFPVFIFGFLTNFLPTFVPVWIRKALRVEYDGFYSSIHFTLGMILFPVFYILQTFLAAQVFSWGIIESIVFLGFQYASRKYALTWWRKIKRALKICKFKKMRLS